MRSDRLQKAMDQQLSSLTVTDDMRQALHQHMEGESPVKKRYKMPIAAVIAAVLVLALGMTAVATSLGVFGQLGSVPGTMNSLEAMSARIDASVTVLDTTYTVDQAYFNGDMLFVSFTESGLHTGENIRWQEPWTYDSQMQMEIEYNHWQYDRPKDGVSPYHNLYISMLEKGESCIVKWLTWPRQALANDVVIDGISLDAAHNSETFLSAEVFDCQLDADQLDVSIPIQLVTDYVRRDEYGQYWHYSEAETMDTLRFTVRRDAAEQTTKYTCSGTAQATQASMKPAALPVDASLSISPATDFACLCVKIVDLPRDWGDLLNGKGGSILPDEFITNWTLQANGETVQPWGIIGSWRASENSYTYYQFFCAEDIPALDDYTIIPEEAGIFSTENWTRLTLKR